MRKNPNLQGKAVWYGPKQLFMMLFTGIMMLLQSTVVTGLTNTVIPLMSADRGWEQTGLLSAVGIASILDGLLIFVLARMVKRNPKMWCGTALVVCAVFQALFAMTPSSMVATVLIILMGVCSSVFCTTCAFILTANWWPTKKGVVLGWTTCGYVVGNIIWTPRVPAYYAAIGITGTHLVMAVIVAVMAVIAFVFVKNTPEEAGYSPDGMTGEDLEYARNVTKNLMEYKSPFTVKKLLKTPSTWTMGLATGFPLCAGMMYLFAFFAAHMSVGYSTEVCSLVMTVGGVASLFGSWLIGVLDQKIGTKKANLLACIMIVIALICCLLRAKSMVFVWVSGIILFCANGAGRNLLPSFVGTKYGRWDYAAAYQLIGTIACLLCALGTFAPAWFSGRYDLMYIVSIIMMVIGIICNQMTDSTFVGKTD